MKRALVADDAEAVRAQLARWLERRGFAVVTADGGRQALALLDSGAAPDIVFLDVWMPELDGLATLSSIRETDADVPVVLFSVDGSAGTIVESMRRGASDFLGKPLAEAELDAVLARQFAPADDGADERLEAALWNGASLAEIRATLEHIADTDVIVLVHGESGVGKEVVARAVHETSSRRGMPFVKVNCAALPGELLESELFGYEKGAFTGAHQRKIGKFEQAEGGTIFLDEIGEMSPTAQAKMLHVLQDAIISRLGGNREIRIDVRVVAATNRDLRAMVASGGFREDLYFRLNVVNLRVPPLRERREEVLPLLEHFVRRYARHYGRPAPTLGPELCSILERHAFPGNIRELENMVKRIVVLGSDEPILADLLERQRDPEEENRRFEHLLKEVEESAGQVPLREVGRRAAQEAERAAIVRVLLRTDWNRKAAARILGVSYKTLLQKIRLYDLRPDE
jgi:two-component system response regulator AtoC